MSQKRLMGWEPTETHRGFDAEGNQVPLAQAWEIVVTREPEWDDTSRNELLALGQYELGVHRCGYHESVIDDPDLFFTPADHTCPVCKVQDAWQRVQHDEDQKVEKKLENNPRAPRPSDGRTTYMRVLSPDEAESLKQRRAVNRGNTPGTGSPRA